MPGEEYASVYILETPYHADKLYDYFIPPDLSGITPGSIVTVPFGRTNRNSVAVVRRVSDSTDAERVKPVSSVTRFSLISEEILSLCDFVKEHTLCTFGDAVRSAVPAAAITRINEYFVAVPGADASEMGERAAMLFSFIHAREKVSLATLRREFGDEAAGAAADLVRAGCVARERIAGGSDGIKKRLMCALAVPKDTAVAVCDGIYPDIMIRSKVQTELLRAIAGLSPDTDISEGADGGIPDDEIFSVCPDGDRVRLRALEKKGLIKLWEIEARRDPYLASANEQGDSRCPADMPLTGEQEHAFHVLGGLYESGEPKGALLHGVTGSGKTRVIIEMIRLVINDGRDAIVLVPEIALTPQTVGIFIAAFGDRVAVMHSGLGAGERFDAWRRIKSGGADVVIGTRSAVFAPVEKLGLIVIDEEQEHTYKSDVDPKYLAHDIARKRCADNKALMILSSATPSLGSYYKAKRGIYTLVELKERYGGARLPEVVISDTRNELAGGLLSPFGAELKRRLKECAEDGKQSIIFLNRRGYSNTLTCRSCGQPVRCPNCSVSLTYHTHRRIEEDSEGEDYLRHRADSGILTCHYCGYRTTVPLTCPNCGSTHMLFSGFGTQKVEEELESILPGVPVIRMDTDTTRTRSSHDTLLSKFRSGEARVLLGTQIVTKGHDFPQVTLVGVLNADASLYLDDYRASERTFAMLTQVIGRAGRASDPGVAVVQTQNPDSEVIKLSAAQDYPSFYESEIRVRRGLVFPPFCDIAVMTLTSPDESLLGVGIKKLSASLKDKLGADYADVQAVVFGPFEAPVYKVQNNCRMRMVIKCKLTRRTRKLFSELLFEFGRGGTRRMTLSVDFNPSSL